MIVLGIETSTPFRGIGIVSEERILGEMTIQEKMDNRDCFFSTLQSLLDEIDLDLSSLDGISISIGPGSFTGLRVGLAAAKGIAMVTGKPLLAVPTLDGLAERISFSPYLLCPILDARKGEVYGSLYRRKGGTGKDESVTIERISDYWVLPPERLLEKIQEEVLFIGTGVEVYGKILLDHLGDRVHFLTPNPLAPSPATIAHFGLLKLQKGEVENVDQLEPLYIRTSQVETG